MDDWLASGGCLSPELTCKWAWVVDVDVAADHSIHATTTTNTATRVAVDSRPASPRSLDGASTATATAGGDDILLPLPQRTRYNNQHPHRQHPKHHPYQHHPYQHQHHQQSPPPQQQQHPSPPQAQSLARCSHVPILLTPLLHHYGGNSSTHPHTSLYHHDDSLYPSSSTWNDTTATTTTAALVLRPLILSENNMDHSAAAAPTSTTAIPCETGRSNSVATREAMAVVAIQPTFQLVPRVSAHLVIVQWAMCPTTSHPRRP